MVVLAAEGGGLDHVEGWLGARAALRSTTPPSGPCAWNTLATGQNAGRHGVFGEVQPRPGTYDLAPTDWRTRRVRTVWEYLAEVGVSVACWNASWTYPPPALDRGALTSVAALASQDPDADVWVLGLEAEATEPVDGMVRQVGEVVPEGTALLVVSAYGVAEARHRVSVAAILEKAGLATLGTGGQPIWRKTRAYAYGDCAQVRANAEGREPQGVVAAGQVDEVVAEVKAALLATEHSETGERLFTGAWSCRELYDGPHVEGAPDVVGVPSDGVQASADGQGGPFVHTQAGTLLARGPMFRASECTHRAVGGAGRRWEGTAATVMDVGPTLLHALGVPLPQDIEGRVVGKLFEPEYLAENPPRYSDALLGPARGVYAEEEAHQVEKRLRDLGYM
jgi:predicted AlkP superfamily phosphohydrolase/phosphomutase